MHKIENKLVQVFKEYISLHSDVNELLLFRHSLNKALCLWAMTSDTKVDKLSDELSMKFAMIVSPKYMSIDERKCLVDNCVRFLESEVSTNGYYRLSK